MEKSRKVIDDQMDRELQIWREDRKIYKEYLEELRRKEREWEKRLNRRENRRENKGKRKKDKA